MDSRATGRWKSITEGNFEALHQGVEFQLIPPIERIQSMEPYEPYPVVTNMWRTDVTTQVPPVLGVFLYGSR